MSKAIAVVEGLAQVFRPVGAEALAGLFAEYDRDRAGMSAISGALSQAHLVRHFVEANLGRDHWRVSIERLGDLGPAVKALDSHYWQRALDLTDVLDTMPQARRDEWAEQIRGHKAPPFERAAVVSTLQDLLAQRIDFFAERVDGLFRALSPDHLTNRPEGFGRRMIINYIYDGLGAKWERVGYVHDLRCVVAKLLGREEPRHFMSSALIEYARREKCGEWVDADGGAIRVRVYKKGTAHLEIHPEISWKLNAILAHLHPHAIPAAHRQRPRTRPPRDFTLYDHPIAAPALEILHHGDCRGTTFTFHYSAEGAARDEARDVLIALGGTPTPDGRITFPYPPHDVIAEVVASGAIPDRYAHQYYPTPPHLAEAAVAAAAIEEGHTVLEPSAGQGHLARFLPRSSRLVEVSDLHCQILRAQGFESVECADFLAWSGPRLVDRVVMNPPFSEGRAVRHLEHAARFVRPGGRLVAILPASYASRRDLLPGWSLAWSDPQPFPGTSIEVSILRADAPL